MGDQPDITPSDQPGDVADHNPEAMTEEQAAVPPKDAEVVQNVLLYLENIDLEFDFKVLDVLEDEMATPLKIEQLKEQLGPMVSTKLFGIANSVHYGRQRSGNITKFIDVVTHLGSETTRTTAIFVALLSLANTDEIRMVFARNFATSKLAELFAARLDVKGDEKSTVTLGGLFVEIGRAFMLMYAEKESYQYKEGFIDRHQAYVGVKVIEKFELPTSLIKIIDHRCFTFVKKNGLALSAIVDMAHAVVNESFTKHGKLRIQSSMPDPQGLVYLSTMGSILKDQFNVMGIGSYIEVVETPYTEAEQRIIDRGE